MSIFDAQRQYFNAKRKASKFTSNGRVPAIFADIQYVSANIAGTLPLEVNSDAFLSVIRTIEYLFRQSID